MDQHRPSRRMRAGLAAGMLALLVPVGPVGAQEAASPSPTPVIAGASMPPLAPGAVAVPFSVAPVDGTEPALTLLTRWRSCGHDAGAPEGAVAHLTESSTEVAIRIDVETSPTGELCEVGTLIRLPVSLEAPLGERSLRDAGHPSREPVINLVDPIDTGLRYSCGYYPSQESYSVAELLGPGLELEAGILPSMAPDMRVVRHDGDEIRVLGPLQPTGWVQEDVWRLHGAEWGKALLSDGRCLLRAQLMENIATATWRLRGRRPTARSRTIAIWVQETVCNGRQLYGRVAQPIVQVRPDAVVIITGSMRDLVTPLGERVEDPEAYFGPYPGQQARGGGYTFIDCPGIGPAPYVITLHRRLGQRALLDGGMFPPREIRPARAEPEGSAQSE